MGKRVKAITWLQLCLALWACFFPALSQARQARPHQIIHDQLDLQPGFPKYEVSCAFVFASITTYAGSYEWEEHYNSSNVLWQVRHRHMVGGFLQIKRTETSGQSGITEELSYFLKDHLGSTSAVLDTSGNVVERPSFDAWGKTRNATTWADVDADTQWLSSQYTNRGYTGHEQLDESGLVHMNGRIYDPEVGRFLSPDPYIQDPEHSQNFNRYIYVLNNPLSYTDPSGHFFVALFAAVINVVATAITAIVQAVVTVGKFVVTAVKAFLSTGVGKFLFGTPTGVGNAALKGATWGGIKGAASGARGSDLLRGILVGAATAAIGTGVLHDMGVSATSFADKAIHTAGHGIVGGAANVALGGRFQDGFLSSVAGAAAGHAGVNNLFKGTGNGNMWGRTAVAGIIGGTASAIGGGKFSNGAYTAAFMHFFNDESGGKGGFWAKAKEIYMDANRGAAVFMDTINPFGNPYKNKYGWYTGKEDWYAASKGASDVGNMSLSLATGKVAINATSTSLTANTVSRGTTTVTSWASKGTTPDLGAGRWVMKGGATGWNFFKTGLGGPKVYGKAGAPWFRLQKPNVPFSNSITRDVPTSSLKWPSGWEKAKGILGQRQIKR